MWILGHKYMQLAMEKARKVGVGVVTSFGGGDSGRIGRFASKAIEADMVGMVTSCQGKMAAPTFGAEPRFGTNPIAIAAPARHEVPLIFDTATTATAFGRLSIAYRDGQPFPAGTIAELDGTPIMEEVPPRPVGEFIMLPQGGDRAHGSHRGYGFSMMAEVLSTMLTGTLPPMVDPDAKMMDRDARERSFFAAFNVAAFCDVDTFKDNMDRMLRTLMETKPAPGHERVVYPGLLSHEEMQRRQVDGVPLHCTAIDWFAGMAEELGVPPLELVG
jgi:LDH2 family malate/lactate/ureidoglycolate dehydrogenase